MWRSHGDYAFDCGHGAPAGRAGMTVECARMSGPAGLAPVVAKHVADSPDGLDLFRDRCRR